MRIGLVDAAGPGAEKAFIYSMHETGFAVVANHGVDYRLVKSIYYEWLTFFRTQAKNSYLAPPGEQDGYFPYRESAGGARRDRKEYFHVRPGGRYPREVSDAAIDYFRQASQCASRLLGWLDAWSPAEVTAELAVPLAASVIGQTGTTLRIQHYLPVPTAPPGQPVRAVAHTDLNLLTVLPAPTQPGLELRDAAGRWHDVPLAPQSVVINGGEILESLTGGYYPATLHRVTNRLGPGPTGSRLSLPLFVHPAPEILIGAGESAQAFLRRRIAELRTIGWQPSPGGAGEADQG
jgi:isopenicillin N synthase-like dioxygenase